MHVVGLNLGGPHSPETTGVACFEARGDEAVYAPCECDGSDVGIYELAARLANVGPVAIGVCSPLSYNPGGGERERDRKLRALLMELGVKHPPTLSPMLVQMRAITLRGVTLASGLHRHTFANRIDVVEVNPLASMVLRGAPAIAMSREDATHGALFDWLGTHGMRGVEQPANCTKYFFAACVGAFVAWQWHLGKAVWTMSAEPPSHWYDFAA